MKTILAMLAGALFSLSFSQPVWGIHLALVAAILIYFFHAQ